MTAAACPVLDTARLVALLAAGSLSLADVCGLVGDDGPLAISCRTACSALALDVCFDKYVHELAPSVAAGTLGAWLLLQSGRHTCEATEPQWSLSPSPCATVTDVLLQEPSVQLDLLCDVVFAAVDEVTSEIALR